MGRTVVEIGHLLFRHLSFFCYPGALFSMVKSKQSPQHLYSCLSIMHKGI